MDPALISKIAYNVKEKKKRQREEALQLEFKKSREKKDELISLIPRLYEEKILPYLIQRANEGETEIHISIQEPWSRIELSIVEWLYNKGWDVNGDFDWVDVINPDGMSKKEVYQGKLIFKL